MLGEVRVLSIEKENAPFFYSPLVVGVMLVRRPSCGGMVHRFDTAETGREDRH